MPEEKEGSVIYQHPQPRLLSKMAGLVGLYKGTVPALPSEPVPASSPDVRVLDRKLEEDEERLKKDNKRWRGVIYLTVATCLLIFCLVLTQVISSVTSTMKPLPNIDVSGRHHQHTLPRSEALVASLAAINRQEEPEARSSPASTPPTELVRLEAEIVTETVVQPATEETAGETEKAEALAGSPEPRAGYVAYIPVPLGGEESKTTATSTTTTPTTQRPRPPLIRHRPFFMPVLFQERGEGQVARRPPLPRQPLPPFARRPALSLSPPRPAVSQQPPLRSHSRFPPVTSTQQRPPFQRHPSFPPINLRPPSEGLSSRPAHPQLNLQRPDRLPTSFNLHQNQNLVPETLPIGPLPLDEEEARLARRVGAMLQHMRQLMQTVRPMLQPESLPSNESMARLLGPPPQRRVPFRRPAAPQTRSFPPPAGYRPGPFRAPISVAPPLPNQRGFASRPAQLRGPPPRAVLQHRPPFQAGSQVQRNFARPPPPPRSRGFPTQRPTLLVGNPQYSYPSTATGIQDILQYIRGEQPPHNGHGGYNSFSRPQPSPYNPNTRYSSSDISHAYNGGSSYHGDRDRYRGNRDRYRGDRGNSRYQNDRGEGYSGPIYPPGYEGEPFSLGSSERPFRLMLDVYPMEDDSERYIVI